MNSNKAITTQSLWFILHGKDGFENFKSKIKHEEESIHNNTVFIDCFQC